MKDQQPHFSGTDSQQRSLANSDNGALLKLRDEQTIIQLGHDRKNRSRSLSVYSKEFGLGKTGLLDIIGHALASGNRFVFADMGCGNGLALREAILLADGFGVRANTNIFGVDVLEVDEAKVKSTVFENPVRLPRQLAQDDFRPQVHTADMDTFQFPEPADLVTFSNSIYYTRNPAEAILNAIGQTSPGGVVCINGLYRLRKTTSGISTSLITSPEQLARGFDVLSSYGKLVLKRNDASFDRDTLSDILFGGTAVLRHRIATSERMLYEYHYEVQSPISQVAQ